MLTLCIDTAYKFLTCALIQNNKIIASKSYECFKKQSEELFDCLNEVYIQANINKNDIDSICISEGPGSYTGVRIAMTLAKVISDVRNIDVYTISTLRLYAGNLENSMVVLNARASRAYVGIYDKDKVILEDCILEVKDIDIKDYNLIGDASLFGLQDNYLDIANCFLETKNVWNKVDVVKYLVPKYLKESESYLQ